MRRIIQASQPYFRQPYPYDTPEGKVYLKFVLYETRKKNVVVGYALTRIAPVGDDPKKKEELQRMLYNIDPCIQLKDEPGGKTEAEMADWYKETFGTPGTPEFEENVRKMNEKLHNNA